MYTNVENSQRKDMMTIIANDLNSIGLTVTHLRPSISTT